MILCVCGIINGHFEHKLGTHHMSETYDFFGRQNTKLDTVDSPQGRGRVCEPVSIHDGSGWRVCMCWCIVVGR